MTDFRKFTVEERVRWGDVDAARIIFYGSYIRFFEIAETELFRAAGLPYGKVFDELNIWLPRIEEGLIATAHFVLVSAQRDGLQPIPVPEELRRALGPYVDGATSARKQ